MVWRNGSRFGVKRMSAHGRTISPISSACSTGVDQRRLSFRFCGYGGMCALPTEPCVTQFPLPMQPFQQINSCRICGNTGLVPILHLGEQSLTGVFPRRRDEPITRGPLELVKCHGGDDACGLVQLRHSYDSSEMYGENYGYRSSLNRSMVSHLRNKVASLQAAVALVPGDVVLDIGSNDGTTLSFYPDDLVRVGMDPTAEKFRRFYSPGVRVIAELFSSERFRDEMGEAKAKIVTSIAMFYDLERPLEFVEQIAAVLHDEGIWHFEQSYMPRMLEQTAYDTICHEHLEYYGLRQIIWVMEQCDLKVVDVQLNDVNGGSFAVTAAKRGSRLQPDDDAINRVLQQEEQSGVLTLEPFKRFAARVFDHRHQLLALLRSLHDDGSRVLGYGASTKGNVILQFCGITPEQIPFIAEVNEDKFGCFTPGTGIPIISEAEARAMRPDFFLVMPWHFRDNLVQREREFLQRGGRMIFPLPKIEVVDAPA
jgi:cyclopropane fatty-acyl-phospholipid synthase-like methyltransferase